MEIGVKNDEQLIKMATIVQRILTSSSNGGDDNIITEEEKAQLLEAIENVQDQKQLGNG